MSNNLLKFYNKDRRGFTLIEVLVALTIVMVGIVGAYGLINQSLAYANNASRRLTAAYLAKEGIEIVRNIRDTNYLKIYSDDGSHSYHWYDGLTGCASGCGADYTSDSLVVANANQPLKLAGNFFKYSATGQDTPYKRIIKVVSQGVYLETTVEVKWGSNQSMVVRENIYDWWEM